MENKPVDDIDAYTARKNPLTQYLHEVAKAAQEEGVETPPEGHVLP